MDLLLLAHFYFKHRYETCVTSWRDPNTCRGRRLRAGAAQSKFKNACRGLLAMPLSGVARFPQQVVKGRWDRHRVDLHRANR